MRSRTSWPTAASLAADTIVTLERSRSRPQVTVLMPLYRQERFVAEAVASVLTQQGIVCEVVLSDDASGDETLQRALDAVHAARGTHEHTVRVRRGSQRLGRWHVIHLIDSAKTDIVVQAHGDDRSMPDRMRRIHAAMVDTDAAFAASLAITIDEAGNPLSGRAPGGGDSPGDATQHASTSVRAVAFDEAVQRPDWAIGAVEAWSVRSQRGFRPLDARHAPLAHDRVVLMRAALLGRAVLLEAPLVERRIHAENWHERLVDDGSELRRKHGWAVGRAVIYDTVLRDIDDAEANRLCEPHVAAAARALAEAQLRSAVSVLRSSHGELLAQGYRLVWQPDDAGRD
jgi:hypothetical protein